MQPDSGFEVVQVKLDPADMRVGIHEDIGALALRRAVLAVGCRRCCLAEALRALGLLALRGLGGELVLVRRSTWFTWLALGVVSHQSAFRSRPAMPLKRPASRAPTPASSPPRMLPRPRKRPISALLLLVLVVVAFVFLVLHLLLVILLVVSLVVVLQLGQDFLEVVRRRDRDVVVGNLVV